MGYDVDEYIRVILKGRAIPASSPIPPDIAGYDPELKTQAQLYDPAAARALLDKFGYKDRDGDGYREAPDGKPLVLERWSAPTTLQRQADEQWKKNMDAIGLQDRVQEGSAARASQDGAPGQDPDAHRRLERRLSRRRELHAAALRPERRSGHGEPGAVPAAGIRQALRGRAPIARFSGAHPALRSDDASSFSPTRRGGCRSTGSRTSSRRNGYATTGRTRSARKSGATSTSIRRSARSERCRGCRRCDGRLRAHAHISRGRSPQRHNSTSAADTAGSRGAASACRCG